MTVAIEELGAVQSMSVIITDDTECEELAPDYMTSPTQRVSVWEIGAQLCESI